MPATLSALRSGLATRLQTLTGIRVYELIPDTPYTPCTVISLDRIGYDSTMARGSDMFEFTVTVVVGRADDRSAQAKLETYLAGTGAQSLKTAVEADPTLGGVALNTRVSEARSIRTVERSDGLTFLECDFSVTVYA